MIKLIFILLITAVYELRSAAEFMVKIGGQNRTHINSFNDFSLFLNKQNSQTSITEGLRCSSVFVNLACCLVVGANNSSLNTALILNNALL